MRRHWQTSSRFARPSTAPSRHATSRWAIWFRLREPHRVCRPTQAPRAGPPTGGAQGGELFDVVDLGSLEVFVSVPEQDAPFVQTGQPVDLTFSELPGETFKGKVVRSSDSLSQQSRTLLAEIQVSDPGAPVAAWHVRFRADALQGPEPRHPDLRRQPAYFGARSVCAGGGEQCRPDAARECRTRPGNPGVRHRWTGGRRSRRGEPQ